MNLRALINTTLPDLCPAGVCTIGSIINRLLPYILGIAGFILLAYFVLGGYDILTSQGDPKKIELGKQKITYAVVGFAIIVLAYWGVQLVGRILGIQAIYDIFQ